MVDRADIAIACLLVAVWVAGAVWFPTKASSRFVVEELRIGRTTDA